MNSLRPILAIATFALAGPAQAALVLDNAQFDPLSGGTFTPTTSIHDFAATKGLPLSFGQLRATTAGTVAFDYYGKEAGYTNQLFVPALGAGAAFTTGTNQWAANLGTPLASTAVVDVAAGLLGFGICTSGGDNVAGAGKCAWNDDAASLQAQWTHKGGNGYRSLGFYLLAPNHWLAFWDDSGAGIDDDFDDMVIGIRFTPVTFDVPEPGALGLLGAGLMMFGLGRRRMQRPR